MNAYSKAFASYSNSLPTREVFGGYTNYLNVCNTLNSLIENKVIPIINENDSVSIDEINFGDNDIVVLAVNADKLVILLMLTTFTMVIQSVVISF
jgi:glutamate 5-kinase